MTYKEIEPSKLAEMYRDYFNNFLSVARFAEYYQLTYGDALKVVKNGRVEHERGVEEQKNGLENSPQ